ncbi:DNA-3-methyladenine glycosylase I [Rhizobiaceae bacterium]|nr:DNA-3-methyladenine glycosylase I [Rhizobiaceae bacterium]
MSDIPNGLMRGPDGKLRCTWHGDKDDYRAYHDHEWGRPQDDEHRLFEKICLEGFQSGLSWLTILRKREAFRAAFAGFDFEKVASFDDEDVERLVSDAGIVRHRGKIVSTIGNATRAMEMVKAEGSLGAYFWSYADAARADRPKVWDAKAASAITTTATSTAMSKDLKKRGWTFVGPTTCYAFMQAMGLVNDHLEGCAYRAETQAAQDAFVMPS